MDPNDQSGKFYSLLFLEQCPGLQWSRDTAYLYVDLRIVSFPMFL